LIEYKFKIDEGDRPWALRNAKLRHTRKLWYFSTALALVQLAVSRTDGAVPSEADVLRALDLPPWDRLDRALEIAGTGRPGDAIRLFNAFIEDVGEPTVRETLDALRYEDRGQCAEHQRLKANSKEFHSALLIVVEQLPRIWRRALLSHFLL